MDTLTFSRCLFLLFIVALSVYFIFLNKSFSKNEHFVEGGPAQAPGPAKAVEAVKKGNTLTSDAVEKIVKDTYVSEYKRAATVKEIQFFLAFNIEKKPTEKELVETIKSSAGLITRAYKEEIKNVVLQESFGTESEIQKTYNNILNRLPNEEELYGFSKMLKNDKKFSLEKLKQALYASDEYKRLEKTQQNMVHSDLMGGVTDRQITLMITKNYKDIVGNETIDSDEMRFMKKKFIEFNLDEKIFRQFLQNYIKNQPFNQQILASEKAQEFVKKEAFSSANEKMVSQEMQILKKELYAELMNDIKRQSLLKDVAVNGEQKAFAASKGYTAQSGTEHTEVKQPNKQVIEILLKTSSTDRTNNYLDSSDVLDTIKKQASCVFDKNAGSLANKGDSKYKKDGDQQNSMAEYINERNSQMLKDTCVRNKTYLGLDEDMVLDPSLKWTIPQRHPPVCVGSTNNYSPIIDQTALIGTLLEDAKNTKVGSILDKIPKK